MHTYRLCNIFLPMKPPKDKQVVTLTINRKVMDRLKTWIAQQEIRHPQNAVVETAITKFLDAAPARGAS